MKNTYKSKHSVTPLLPEHKAIPYMKECLEKGIHSEHIDQRTFQDCIYHYMGEYVKLKTVFDNN